jgi:hypothetical protein
MVPKGSKKEKGKRKKEKVRRRAPDEASPLTVSR